MVHQGQRLPFGLETGHDLARVHAGFDDFQGHLAANGLLLLGDEDQPHAPFADLLQELVVADDAAEAVDGAHSVVVGGDRSSRLS